MFKSFENTEEQENRTDLTLASGQKGLNGKDVWDAVAAMKELGWTVPGVEREASGNIHIQIDHRKALGNTIGQMEVSEVGMNNVYKKCLNAVIVKDI